jgi:hypothetical protein
MSFDAWVVGFGLSRVLIDLNLIESPWAYGVMAVTILMDTYLLYLFFTVQKAARRAPMCGRISVRRPDARRVADKHTPSLTIPLWPARRG